MAGVGVESSFEAFAQARLGQLLGFGYRLTGNRESAEDLVQEALARTAQRWRSVRRSDRPEVYVQTVMTRLHIDRWRRDRREDLRAVLPDGHRPEADREAVMDMRQALDQLAPRQRTVIILRYYLDWTEAQAAAAMGCSVGTVKSQTSDALHRLRRLLGDAEPQEGRR